VKTLCADASVDFVDVKVGHCQALNLMKMKPSLTQVGEGFSFLECGNKLGYVSMHMKHASAATLQQLSELLAQIRQRQGLKEKKLGIFYQKSKSFLHFHEDPAGIFADISYGDQFRRFPASTTKQRQVLLKAIDRALKSSMR
jgi:hypothetical protein